MADQRVKQQPTPAIARIWRGRTTRARADEYQTYRADESEFVTISYWESVEAMSRFAGKDPRRIHHLPRDGEFLIELPKGVQVLEIVSGNIAVGRGSA
jgi:heme-degrading monooxygenase HmoA